MNEKQFNDLMFEIKSLRLAIERIDKTLDNIDRNGIEVYVMNRNE